MTARVRSLFDFVPAQLHSATSIDAAEAVKPRRRRLQEAVLDALRRFGPQTDNELISITGLNASTLRPRRVELVRAGQVVADGERNGSTVWRLARPGERTELPQPWKERCGRLEELLIRFVNTSSCTCGAAGDCLRCQAEKALAEGGR